MEAATQTATLNMAISDLFADCGMFHTDGGMVYRPIPLGQIVEECVYFDGNTGRTETRFLCRRDTTVQPSGSYNNISSWTVGFWQVVSVPTPTPFEASEIGTIPDIGSVDNYVRENGTFKCQRGIYYCFENVPGHYASDIIGLAPLSEI